MHHSSRVLIAVLAAASLWSASVGSALGEAPARRPLALVGGTIQLTPTADPIRNGALLVEDGLIAAVGDRASVPIPPGAETLDCSGLTITAGFWNSHIHFVERKWSAAQDIPAVELGAQLREMLTRWGVTSAFDTGSAWENTRRIRERIESGEVPGPRIRSTGPILFPKGASSPDPILDILGFMHGGAVEVADAGEALAESKKVLDAGADGVKLYAATWFPPFAALPESAMRSAVEEAHRRGKPAFAHPTHREGLLAAVRAGVDVVAHTTPQSGPWDDSVLEAMKQANVAVIPTLELWGYELRHDRPSSRERFSLTAIDQLRAWAAVGGTILFGTDVGYMSDYDPTDEYALLERAGLSFRQILAALTTAPAERFGDSKRLGRIAPGFKADLAVLEGDPSSDVSALAAVRYTLRDGVVIYRRGE